MTLVPPPESPVALAESYGLKASSARPPLLTYVKQLWERRHFIRVYATSRSVTKYSQSMLGGLWHVLTPLFNAGVYLLIFGLVLRVDRGIPNYLAFLVTGVFVMNYSTSSVTSGARSISGNLSLIRALHFPRASLPLSSTLIELRQLMFSMLVLVTIVLVTPVNLVGDEPMTAPEPITWLWLLLVPALFLQTVFNIGLAFIMARVGAAVTDIQQLLPFALRVWLYSSGVIFPLGSRLEGRVPDWAIDILMANPAAVYIELVRSLLMQTHDAWFGQFTWVLAAVWALVLFGAGFVYFWGAEEKYGRG
ncbi:ABC transporter permease [Actinopolymorpha sp. B11F2]|uniref:ABC transporter permease n=1 Tax=Actinopolymorpha sp. B11F2 TaxID=3160862 RepID=UPI0032E44B3D